MSCESDRRNRCIFLEGSNDELGAVTHDLATNELLGAIDRGKGGYTHKNQESTNLSSLVGKQVILRFG